MNSENGGSKEQFADPALRIAPAADARSEHGGTAVAKRDAGLDAHLGPPQRRPSRTTGRSAPLGGRLDRRWPTQEPTPGHRARRRRVATGTIAWLDAYGRWKHAELDECLGLPVWTFPPTREPHLHRGRRTVCGWVAFGRPAVMTAYESAAERDVLLDLEFDRDVIEVAAQPFVVRLADDTEHRPDFAALLTDGRVVIIEVKDDSKARLAHEAERGTGALRETLAVLGWTYLTLTPSPLMHQRNLRWLRGCRPQVDELAELTAPMLAAAEKFTTISMLAALAHPAISRPVLGRLLWDQQLSCDLDPALCDETSVWAPGESACVVRAMSEQRGSAARIARTAP